MNDSDHGARLVFAAVVVGCATCQRRGRSSDERFSRVVAGELDIVLSAAIAEVEGASVYNCGRT